MLKYEFFPIEFIEQILTFFEDLKVFSGIILQIKYSADMRFV